jgi:hypothetical protein
VPSKYLVDREAHQTHRAILKDQDAGRGDILVFEQLEVVLAMHSLHHPTTTPSGSRRRRPELRAGRGLQRERVSERQIGVRIHLWHKSDALPKLTASKVKEFMEQSVVSVPNPLEVTSTEHSSLLQSSQW